MLTPVQFKVLFGHKLTLSGSLARSRSGERVIIEAWPYHRSSPTKIGIVLTTASGRFSFKVTPQIQTTYRVHASQLTSHPITVGVAPSVVVRELVNGRIWARVEAGRSFSGRIVKLLRKSSGTWVSVAQKSLSTASIAVFSPSLPTSMIRVTLSVNEAGAGYLGASSHALVYKTVYKTPALSIAAPSSKVLFGHKVRLSGRLLNGRAGQRISIEAWPYGASSPHNLADVTTGLGGAWTVAVSPKVQTTYRAISASAQMSAGLVVGVRPLMSIRELGNGRVAAHVIAGRLLAGRMVKLQTLAVGGTWLTVAQRPLSLNSRALFVAPLHETLIRVAMSVNQAGAGLLGTTSHPLAYHAV